MSKSKHTEAQIIAALKKVEAGCKAEDVATNAFLESSPRAQNQRVIKIQGENHEDVNFHPSIPAETMQWGFPTKDQLITFGSLLMAGAIEVITDDPNDKVTRGAIRNHLSHIAQMFTNRNFRVPGFIHDTVPPEVPVMKSKRASIDYVFEPMPNGGRVRITTTDADALKAVHQFLTFQIDDH